MSLKGRFFIETSGGTFVYTLAEIFNQGGTPENINLSVLFSEPQDSKAHPTAMRNYTFAPDMSSSDNLWVQGYAHLKTQTDFAGAEDV
ncbi:hypothetical protein [Klebsiella quasipneumoniae]|uniref:hypothetical protein n=1 Tax=Klebsiella quasipneumoniae TaxID=1463165 RepID=UPI00358DF250